MSVDPSSRIHGEPMPIGHVGVTVIRVLKGTVYIPYPPPHEPEVCTLAEVVGYVIPWPCVALAVCL